ncbi:XdhC family protein [Microvirga calopogonii]|uniref:XdhC family protein n=1 Tax=Microvirga calopogonii TaxID=2078013 RepID=UPI0013B3DF4E|nr:XdhC family protein [Microvirga calopogonii]
MAEADRRAALVTITGLTGSSSRPVGTLMGVAEDGRFAGSFSGGCIEAAVVAEAIEAIRDGQPRQVRYGAGSPYIDIRLPCGGGVDLLFLPMPDPDVVRQAVSCLEARQPLTLAQSASGGLHVLADSGQPRTGWQEETFVSWYAPPLRLVVVGYGAESLALIQLGLASGTQVALLTSDERLITAGVRLGANTNLLSSSGPSPALVADPWSAVVFLFHDHAWEPSLLEQVITQPWFFIGAMGSRRTHANRLEQLRERGLPEEALARITAPLGLIPSARDPMTLALSALAHVIDRYRLVATAEGSY